MSETQPGLGACSCDWNYTINRAKRILLEPKTVWAEVAEDQKSIKDLYLNYALPLAAIPAVVGFVNGSIIGTKNPFSDQVIRTSVGAGVVMMLVGFVVTLAMLFIAGLVMAEIAKRMGGDASQTDGFKLALFPYTASAVGSIFTLLPFGSLISLVASIYGLYLFYQGTTPLVKVPESGRLVYCIVTIVALAILGLVLSIVLGVLGFAGLFAAGIAAS